MSAKALIFDDALRRKAVRRNIRMLKGIGHILPIQNTRFLLALDNSSVLSELVVKTSGRGIQFHAECCAQRNDFFTFIEKQSALERDFSVSGTTLELVDPFKEPRHVLQSTVALY